jgi:hypothetical protein
MSDRIIGRKKSAASTFTNPSLASPGIPTLANPIHGFGSQINTAPLQTVTEVAPELQEAQSADGQLSESEAIKEKPLSHDISRISLRRPQAKLTVGQPGDKYEQEADMTANQVMSMPDSGVQDEILPEEQIQEKVQTKPLAAAITPLVQREQKPQNIQPILRAVIQRDDQTDKNLNPQEGALLLLEKNRPSVESARANALVRLGKITKLQSDGNRAIGSLKGQLLRVSERYDQAYKQFATVMAAAQQEARDQQELVDLVVGIAIGVAVGLCFEAVGAAALVEGLSKGAATGLGKWAFMAAGEAAGEVGEAGTAKATGGLTDVAGKDIQPDGLKPEVLKMEIWKSLSKLHESMAKIGSGSLDQALLMAAAEYAIGEIKAQRGGGADMTPDEDADLVMAVLGTDKGSKTLDKALDQASEKMSALEGSIANMPNYDVIQMEKDIWILWMSRLKKDSNIIDIDAIEDHLASLGIVDFGMYTTDAEENEAIEKAQQQAAEVRKRRNQAVSAGTAGPTLGSQ